MNELASVIARWRLVVKDFMVRLNEVWYHNLQYVQFRETLASTTAFYQSIL